MSMHESWGAWRGLALAGVAVLAAVAAANVSLDTARATPAPSSQSAPVRALRPGWEDVCALVPGSEVARVLGRTLKEARPFASKDSGVSRCTYVLASPKSSAGQSQGFTLWVYGPGAFDELLRVHEGPYQKVRGLGDEAIAFRDSGDGRFKLRAVVRGKLTVEATAADVQSPGVLARLALQRLAR